jgi:hypothetical protein
MKMKAKGNLFENEMLIKVFTEEIMLELWKSSICFDVYLINFRNYRIFG